MSDPLAPTETGGIAESGFFPAVIQTARVVSVNVRDWSLDLVSEYGNQRYFDIQWMNPYLHFINGEGIYVMPEAGAICWICKPSGGKMATPFVLGFKTEIDERDEETEGPALNYRANRQTLNPGDMMMKTRDENFLILRRGGVLQLGSTPISQRIYVPIGNLIRDICENYLLQSLAGDMEWTVQGERQSDRGDAKTFFRLRSKTTALDPEHAVVLTTGSHPDDDNLRLSLVVKPDGAEGSATIVSMTMDKDGNVSWTVEGAWALDVKGDVNITSREGDLTLETLKKSMFLTSAKDITAEAQGNAALAANGGDADLFATGNATVTGKLIALNGKTQVGGTGGEPLVKGLTLLNILTQLIQGMFDASAPHGPVNTPPGFPVLMPVVAKLLPQLQNMLSTNNTTT